MLSGLPRMLLRVPRSGWGSWLCGVTSIYVIMFATVALCATMVVFRGAATPLPTRGDTVQTIHRTCECETVPDRNPDLPDRRIPNPLCRAHADRDDMDPGDYDADDTLECFGLAWSYQQTEWVEADGIDDITGEPYLEDGAA